MDGVGSEPGAFGKRIMELAERLAQWSEIPDGLTCTYLSPAHRSVAAEIRDWMRQGGLITEIDAVANVVGRYAAFRITFAIIGQRIPQRRTSFIYRTSTTLRPCPQEPPQAVLRPLAVRSLTMSISRGRSTWRRHIATPSRSCSPRLFGTRRRSRK